MYFHSTARPDSLPLPPASATLRWCMVGACALAGGASAAIWLQVQFPILIGHVAGVRGIETSAGFTCAIVSVMAVLIAMLEDRTSSTRRAVQPGVLTMLAIAAAVMVWRFCQRAGSLAGASASFTAWFYAALVGSLAALAAAALRLALLRRSGR